MLSEVYCVRTMVEDVEGTDNSFCWGSCYPPAIDTSAISVTIMAQVPAMSLQVIIIPMGFPA